MRFQRFQKPFSNVLRASVPLCDTSTATFRFIFGETAARGESPPLRRPVRPKDERTTGQKVEPRTPSERGAGEESPPGGLSLPASSPTIGPEAGIRRGRSGRAARRRQAMRRMSRIVPVLVACHVSRVPPPGGAARCAAVMRSISPIGRSTVIPTPKRQRPFS